MTFGPSKHPHLPTNNARAIQSFGIPIIDWWAADSQYLSLTSDKLVTCWTGSINGNTLTDAQVVAGRPPYTASNGTLPAYIDFSSGTKFLFGAHGLLYGHGDSSIIMLGRISNSVGAVGTMICYDPYPNAAGARSFFYQPAPNTTQTTNYIQDATATKSSEWITATGIDSTSWHCWVNRQRYADGISASKPIRQDGSNLAGSYSTAQDVSTTTTYMQDAWIQVGSLVGSFGANILVSDIVICPFLTDTQADTLYRFLWNLRFPPVPPRTPNQIITDLIRVVSGVNGEIWLGERGIQAIGSAVQAWTGSNRGLILSDGGSAGRRPTLSGPNVMFDGVGNYLQGAANILSGSTGFTYIWAGNAAPIADGTVKMFFDYGISTARAGAAHDFSTYRNSFYMYDGVNVNERADAVAPTTPSVWTYAGDSIYGTNAADVMENNATNIGSNIAAGDVTGLKLGSSTFTIAARNFDTSFITPMTGSCFIVVPSQLSQSNIDLITNLLRNLRNI